MSSKSEIVCFNGTSDSDTGDKDSDVVENGELNGPDDKESQSGDMGASSAVKRKACEPNEDEASEQANNEDAANKK